MLTDSTSPTLIRCAILDDYQNVAMKMADWSQLAGRVKVKTFQQHFNDEDELISAVKEYEIIVIMRERTPFPASVIKRLPKLKLLITSGMRNAAIDLDAAAQYGIEVSGTTSYSEPPTEMTWALILGLARHLVQESQAFKTNGPWQNTVGVCLQGKTLGILGLGKIGSRIASIAQAFGMQTIAWSQNLTQEQADSVGVHLANSKNELLASSDFISIHLVLSDRTRHLIGAEEFKLMRPTGFLINTSRAQIIDTAALVYALQNNIIAGAGLDVFENEPVAATDILRTLPNLLATPHLGYVIDKNYHVYFSEAIENIIAYLDGKSMRSLLKKQ